MSVHSGWQRALDTQMDTLKNCNSEPGRLWNAAFFSSHFYETRLGRPIQLDDELAEDGIDMARHVCITLWRGDTIYITSDMLHLIMQAAHDLPSDVTFEEESLLSQYGFVMFEEPIIGEDTEGGTVVINAISWELNPVATVDDPRRVLIIYFWTDPHDDRDVFAQGYVEALKEHAVPLPPLVLAHFYVARMGQRVPESDERGSELVTGILKLFLAMNIIAQQKIGTPVRLDPDRASRKRYNREWGKDAPERIITLITLRRKSVKKDDEEPKKVEWSRRWVVRGFWRRQYYPSAKQHHWKYIHEYIKGPEDKPLIVTERRIFNFRR